MWYWLFIFLCDLLIPVIMIIAGRIMWKHPPKEINGLIGYRTARSMKTMDTWHFAQDFCGKLWWKIGWIMLLPSMLILIPIYGKTENVIGIVGIILMIVQLIVLISSLFPTEKALKSTFTDTGLRK